MTTIEAVRSGLRISRRYPRVGAIETLWRTAFGILVLLFVLLGIAFFLQNVRLSDLEVRALRSGVPLIVSLTMQHLIRQYGGDLWRLGLFVAALSGFMWLLFATLFRSVTLGMILNAYRREKHGKSPAEPEHAWSEDIRVYAPRVGWVNALFLFFTSLVLILSGGVIWGSVQLGVLAGETLGPVVVIASLTLGLTFMFILGTLVDWVTDLACLAVVFEGRRFGDSLRRAAEVIQKRFLIAFGIGGVIFLMRMVLVLLFGLGNLFSNFILGLLWPPLILPVTVLLWFLQSVLLYYIYIVNLASYANLFDLERVESPTALPVAGKMAYEQ